MKGIIFDLDGTLIDSMTVWEDADRIILNRYGFMPDLEYREKIVKLNFSEGVNFIIEKFGIKKTYEEISRELWDIVFKEYETMPLKEGVYELIAELKKRGVKIALATSSIKEMCFACLKNNGIFDLFDEMVFSEEVGKNKTNPDVYIEAAKRIGVLPSECIVFEDAPHAVCGARLAKMKVIGVYDVFFKEKEDELRKMCDKFIYSMKEVNFDILNEL